MTCHILHTGTLEAFCGKRTIDMSKGDSYVDELSRVVMEMPTCLPCRRAFLQDRLDRLGRDSPEQA